MFKRYGLNGMLIQSDCHAFEDEKFDFVINVSECQNPHDNFVVYYPDLVPIDPRDLLKVAQIVEGLVKQGKRVVIHCSAGVHRSVTFSLASIMYIKRIGIREAMEELKEPKINFVQYLLEIPFHYISLLFFEKFFLS